MNLLSLKGWLILGIIGNTLDKITTYYAMTQNGFFEMNPLMRSSFSYFGIGVSIILFFIFAMLSLWILYHAQKEVALAIVACALVMVGLSNLFLIIGSSIGGF